MRNLLMFLVLIACLSLSACSPGYYRQARILAKEGDHNAASSLYYEEIKMQPDSYRAWRELGITLYEQGEYGRAEEALKQASSIKPEARTQLYLGMTYEQDNRTDLALRAYGNALALKPRGRTSSLLEARVQNLTQSKVLNEVRLALAQEDELDLADIPENTVAVVEFAGESLPPELASLTKGLAEFTALDLGKISSLTIVDRLKIDTLRKELALSQSKLADPKTAPLIGRLVGGRRVVTGTLLGLGDQSIRLDGAVVNTVDQSIETADHADGPLDEIFRIQKQFVFDIIDAMDITLTPEERTEIEKVPTENYLAFLAYCRGLDYRDRNDLGAARIEFQKAASTDRNFVQASGQQRTVASLISSGIGGGATVGQFTTAAAAASDAEINAGDLANFQSIIVGWNGFVPVGVDLSQWADSPPHTLFQGNVDVVIRGNLDVQP